MRLLIIIWLIMCLNVFVNSDNRFIADIIINNQSPIVLSTRFCDVQRGERLINIPEKIGSYQMVYFNSTSYQGSSTGICEFVVNDIANDITKLYWHIYPNWGNYICTFHSIPNIIIKSEFTDKHECTISLRI